MADESENKQKFESQTFEQLAQKCMRCRKYLCVGQKIIADPKWKDCLSHAKCVPEDEQKQYEVWKAKHKRP